MSENILGNIVGVASEGQGIIRYEGLVIFIPFTVTGDIIRYRITKQKKNFALGELVEVVEPSPLRIAPLCPYFGTCGGCQMQHVRYDAQLALKRQWVEDALKKIAGLVVHVPPVVPALQQWNYRRRINLVLRPDGDAFQAGYTTDNRSLVAVEQCPIFADSADPIVSTVHSMAKQLVHAGPEEGRAAIHKSNDNRYTIHLHFKTMPENIEDTCKKVLGECGSITGILATSARKTLQWGVLDTSLQIDSLRFEFSPKAFIQNHPEQSLKIYQEIEALGKKYTPKSVLDLYCGIGISSCLLARQGIAVTGIEANPEAVRLAQKNAKINKIKGSRFIAANVESVLNDLLTNSSFDMVIVNPPREGLSPAVVQALCEHPSKTLVYISCMPSTLARDLKLLCAQNYSVDAVTAFDMFPQTVHVETMVVAHKVS